MLSCHWPSVVLSSYAASLFSRKSTLKITPVICRPNEPDSVFAYHSAQSSQLVIVPFHCSLFFQGAKFLQRGYRVKVADTLFVWHEPRNKLMICQQVACRRRGRPPSGHVSRCCTRQPPRAVRPMQVCKKLCDWFLISIEKKNGRWLVGCDPRLKININ